MVQPSEGSHAFMVCALAKVGLMMLMAMRDGGVAFQAEPRRRSGQIRQEDGVGVGGVKGQRAWEMGEWQIKH
jgi:hypothetical protein